MGLTRQNCMKISKTLWNFVVQQRNLPEIRSCRMSLSVRGVIPRNAWLSLHFDKINVLLQLTEQKTVFWGDVPGRRRQYMFSETK